MTPESTVALEIEEYLLEQLESIEELPEDPSQRIVLATRWSREIQNLPSIEYLEDDSEFLKKLTENYNELEEDMYTIRSTLFDNVEEMSKKELLDIIETLKQLVQ